MSTSDLEAQLVGLARNSQWFWPALVSVRNLNLSSWCISAGAVRTLVWDSLHQFSRPSELPDIDVAYFDPTDLSKERELMLQSRLASADPQLPWEVTNQAAVHAWYEAAFGFAVPALTSLEDGIGTWPEYATSVGLTLLPNDSIKVIAPHGLDDLFAMVVRWNPSRVDVETYRKRVEQKRYCDRWPQVVVVPC